MFLPYNSAIISKFQIEDLILTFHNASEIPEHIQWQRSETMAAIHTNCREGALI
jgi:hypothetical protein